MTQALIISRDPKFLENLFCGCGKPAGVGWHLPVEKDREKVRKLSKTPMDEDAPKEPKKAQPYGWACGPTHVPPELREKL